MQRPDRSEYFEYYDLYVGRVPEGDIISTLESELEETLGVLREVPESKAELRYAPGKWSVKEVVGHIVDVERMFSGRALSFARRDPTPLPSFEQDPYVENSGADRRRLEDLADELAAVRRSSITLFKSFDEETSQLTGTASDREFSVRSIAYIIAGHEIHHRTLLKKRYLPLISPA